MDTIRPEQSNRILLGVGRPGLATLARSLRRYPSDLAALLPSAVLFIHRELYRCAHPNTRVTTGVGRFVVQCTCMPSKRPGAEHSSTDMLQLGGTGGAGSTGFTVYGCIHCCIRLMLMLDKDHRCRFVAHDTRNSRRAENTQGGRKNSSLCTMYATALCMQPTPPPSSTTNRPTDLPRARARSRICAFYGKSHRFFECVFSVEISIVTPFSSG